METLKKVFEDKKAEACPFYNDARIYSSCNY